MNPWIIGCVVLFFSGKKLVEKGLAKLLLRHPLSHEKLRFEETNNCGNTWTSIRNHGKIISITTPLPPSFGSLDTSYFLILSSKNRTHQRNLTPSAPHIRVQHDVWGHLLQWLRFLVPRLMRFGSFDTWYNDESIYAKKTNEMPQFVCVYINIHMCGSVYVCMFRICLNTMHMQCIICRYSQYIVVYDMYIHIYIYIYIYIMNPLFDVLEGSNPQNLLLLPCMVKHPLLTPMKFSQTTANTIWVWQQKLP